MHKQRLKVSRELHLNASATHIYSADLGRSRLLRILKSTSHLPKSIFLECELCGRVILT